MKFILLDYVTWNVLINVPFYEHIFQICNLKLPLPKILALSFLNSYFIILIKKAPHKYIIIIIIIIMI